MNQEQFTSWIKTTLGVVGGVATTYGVGTSSVWMGITGVAVTLAPLAWGYLSNTHLAQVQRAAAIPDVAKVVMKSSATNGLAAAAADPRQPKITSL